jgi:hypothetical protein
MPLYVKNNKVISSSDITSAGVFKTKVNRDGLVLYYDGADLSSNNGGGSTWTDLSGSGYNGTLTNGASFTSTNGGSVLFDGSNDYVETNSSTIIPNGLSPFTIEALYTMTGTGGGALFVNYGPGYTSGTIWFSGQYGVYVNGAVYAAGAPLSTGTRHLVSTRNSDGFTSTYINGVLSNTGMLTASISNSQNYRIGTDVNGTAEPFAGHLYLIRVYNRALNPYEISENFQANRGRVGL